MQELFVDAGGHASGPVADRTRGAGQANQDQPDKERARRIRDAYVQCRAGKGGNDRSGGCNESQHRELPAEEPGRAGAGHPSCARNRCSGAPSCNRALALRTTASATACSRAGAGVADNGRGCRGRGRRARTGLRLSVGCARAAARRGFRTVRAGGESDVSRSRSRGLDSGVGVGVCRSGSARAARVDFHVSSGLQSIPDHKRSCRRTAAPHHGRLCRFDRP